MGTTLSVALTLAALSLAPTAALGQRYRYPLGGCHSGCATVSAYYDLDSGGGVRDWNCGAQSYNGHRGSDFAIYGTFTAQDAGRNVVAAAAGTVIASHDGEFDRCTSGSCAGGGGFGNYVAVRHADGKVTYYGHMRRGSVRVSTGATVTCGQQLGLVGSSGYSTGPHLHFEVRVGGTSADDPYAARSGCGGPESYWVSQGAYRALPSESCESPPPQPVECLHRAGTFSWNCAGPIGGLHCVPVPEAADPDSWSDNHVCTDADYGLRWSNSGPIAGMLCTRIEEPSEPAAHAWTDNYLCLPAGSSLRLRWSYAGPVAGMDCVRWREPSDPHDWDDNHLCWTRETPRDASVDAPPVTQDTGLPVDVRPTSDVARDLGPALDTGRDSGPALDATPTRDVTTPGDTTPPAEEGPAPPEGMVEGSCACRAGAGRSSGRARGEDTPPWGLLALAWSAASARRRERRE